MTSSDSSSFKIGLKIGTKLIEMSLAKVCVDCGWSVCVCPMIDDEFIEFLAPSDESLGQSDSTTSSLSAVSTAESEASWTLPVSKPKLKPISLVSNNDDGLITPINGVSYPNVKRVKEEFFKQPGDGQVDFHSLRGMEDWHMDAIQEYLKQNISTMCTDCVWAIKNLMELKKLRWMKNM